MEELQKRLSNLLTIKSMVTLILTVVFACLTCGGRVSAGEFLTVYAGISGYYLGTKRERSSRKSGDGT